MRSPYPRPRLLCTAGLLVALGVLGVSCGDDAATARAEARTIETLDAAVPLTMNGLDVDKEDITETLEGARRPYLDAVALYSFREDDLLQATLQIGRFAPDVDISDDEFVDGLVARVSTSAKELRMGDTNLWMGGNETQTLTVWFDDAHMFVLSTRAGFDGGRALLRRAVEIEP